jgi:glycosyltransferase involved in cell wall biosynthesis
MTPPPRNQSAADDTLEQPVDAWPLVSVVVPTYRRPQLLRTTVQSILDQRYPGPIEILVVFDRDEEPVRPDVTVPEGRDLRLLRNDRTPGPAGGYNVGSLAATGQYVALCDDDDEWLPDKLRRQIEAFRSHPDALLGTCGIYLGDGRSRTRNPARLPKKEVMSLQDLLRTPRNEMHTSTMTFDRERMLREVGLVDEDIPGSYGEDYDWWIRAARLAPVVAVRQPLVRVRWQHSYFADRWPTIIDSITYQLERRPELKQDPGNLARLYGRLAFAHAAVGHRDESHRWARMSRELNWRQPRIYLAYLVSTGLVKPKTVLRLAHALGRGV